MRRYISLVMGVALSFSAIAQPKYVFYFIGDGMGVNQVNGQEMYEAEQQGRIGIEPLLFTQFPVATVATTYSASNGVTDSSAGGTALATGGKSYNGAIAVDTAKQALTTVAERAKRSGKKVGVITSVSVDHATPASFYAHQPQRSMYYEIACDLPKAGFDFYGGSGFLKPTTSADGSEQPSIFPIFEEAGYTLARGIGDYKAKAPTAEKMILIQEEGKPQNALPYAIDREADDMTLAQITESAIEFLTRNNKNGFFLMVEGGKIDWACHGNDGATVFEEIKDMDAAIKVAYEFYKKHPKETLIVVTADHETGGIFVGKRHYKTNLQALANQKHSVDGLSARISKLRDDRGKDATWDDAKAILSDEMGFWTAVPLTWKQERALHDQFDRTFNTESVEKSKSLYASNEPLATTARDILNDIAMLGWGTGDHTAGYVPVYAIGDGSAAFGAKIDNTEIPLIIAREARYK